jgi:hypothetical protein
MGSQFQAIEQRATEENVMVSQEQSSPDSMVGATIVVRSETVVTEFRIVSNALQAEDATTEMLSTVVKALSQGVALDLIVGRKAMYDAPRSCADIVSHGWNVNQYCQHQG